MELHSRFAVSFFGKKKIAGIVLVPLGVGSLLVRSQTLVYSCPEMTGRNAPADHGDASRALLSGGLYQLFFVSR